MFITKFVNNNKLFAIIDMSLFFINKNFNFRIIIDFDEIFYEFTRERFLIVKVENIIDIITNILKLIQNNFQRSKQVITIQINKHQKLIKYNFKNKIWLFNNNIIIVQSFKKLKNKMLKFFEIIKAMNIFYKLKLFFFMKVHSVFHINLLWLNLDDSLLDQIINTIKSMKIVNENE